MRGIASKEKIPILDRRIAHGPQRNEVFIVDKSILNGVIAETKPNFIPNPLVGRWESKIPLARTSLLESRSRMCEERCLRFLRERRCHTSQRQPMLPWDENRLRHQHLVSQRCYRRLQSSRTVLLAKRSPIQSIVVAAVRFAIVTWSPPATSMKRNC